MYQCYSQFCGGAPCSLRFCSSKWIAAVQLLGVCFAVTGAPPLLTNADLNERQSRSDCILAYTTEPSMPNSGKLMHARTLMRGPRELPTLADVSRRYIRAGCDEWQKSRGSSLSISGILYSSWAAFSAAQGGFLQSGEASRTGGNRMRVMAAARAGTMPGARPAQAFRVGKARPLAGELQGSLCTSEV